MYNNSKLLNHPSLTSHGDISQICQPLFELLGVNYFAFHRIYHDGTVIRLCTYPETTERYITQNFFKKIKIDQYSSNTPQYQYHLWNQYNQYDPKGFLVFLEAFNNFKLSPGFSIIRNYGGYIDSYNLAIVNNINPKFHEGTYLTMIEPIEKFMAHFLGQAADLIKASETCRFKTRIIKPKIASLQKEINFSPLRSLIEIQEESEGYKFNEHEIESSPLVPTLSNRQYDCGSLLVQGLTVKEIARNLNISPRTVEDYIGVLKHKLGTNNRAQLIIKLNLIL